MSWNQSLSDLQFRLATLFPLKEDILQLTGKAGLPPASLTISDKGLVFWYNVLTEARQRGLLDEIVAEALRLYPEDKALTSFNTMMMENEQELRIDILKDLCADIIREGQMRSAMPLAEEIVQRSPVGQNFEEEIVIQFAETQRHASNSIAFSGRKRSKSLRFLESSKSDLIALIQAL
jgi:hypothetical protein